MMFLTNMFSGHTRYVWIHTKDMPLKRSQVFFDIIYMLFMTGRVTSPPYVLLGRRASSLQCHFEPEDERRADCPDLF
jgi:hypothetical protein